MTIVQHLFILLMVEVLLLGSIAHLVVGLPWLLTLLFVVFSLFGLRCLVVLGSWMFTRFYPSPAIGPWRRVKMMAQEMLAYLYTFTLLLPFEPLLMAPDRLRPCQRPVLLVHGYGCSRGIWRTQRARLEAAGHVVATITLMPPFGHIDDMVPLLATRIDDMLAQTGADKLVLVGHSMGGLVCRDYLAIHGGDKVVCLITLAPPIRAVSWPPLDLGPMPARWNPVPAGCSVSLRSPSAYPASRCAPVTTMW